MNMHSRIIKRTASALLLAVGGTVAAAGPSHDGKALMLKQPVPRAAHAIQLDPRAPRAQLPTPAPRTLPPTNPPHGPTLKPGVHLPPANVPEAVRRQLQPRIRPEDLRAAGCPDPAVTLQVGWPGRNRDGSYRFHVIAVIKNRGNATFQARRSQTGVQINEAGAQRYRSTWPSGALNTVELAPGEQQSAVTQIVKWRPNSEFIGDFTGQITYGPDMPIDGNPRSKDCNRSNNRAVLTVDEVKRAIARVLG